MGGGSGGSRHRDRSPLAARARSPRRCPRGSGPAATLIQARWSQPGSRASVLCAVLAAPRSPVDERLCAVLSLVLPKGSLERATLELFDAADLTVRRSSDRD